MHMHMHMLRSSRRSDLPMGRRARSSMRWRTWTPSRVRQWSPRSRHCESNQLQGAQRGRRGHLHSQFRTLSSPGLKRIRNVALHLTCACYKCTRAGPLGIRAASHSASTSMVSVPSCQASYSKVLDIHDHDAAHRRGPISRHKGA